MAFTKVQKRKLRQAMLAIALICFSLITLWLDVSFVPHWWELWPIITLAAGILMLRPLFPKQWQM